MTEDIVLLPVEDEPLILMRIKSLLEDGGYTVLTAAAGDQAMGLLEQRHEEICGLITDIKLGDGPSGWELAHHARELEPRISIVYMSGDSASDWPIEGVPKSVMLQKPFADAQLLTAISTLLNEVDAN
ncbi:MAG: response regulator [Novosphingobium sp.]